MNTMDKMNKKVKRLPSDTWIFFGKKMRVINGKIKVITNKK